MKFSDLNLDIKTAAAEVKIPGTENTLALKQYLPQQEKANLIAEIISLAMDYNTNTFSPIRVETYFSLVLAKYYAGIEFDEADFGDNVGDVYDVLETNHIFNLIVENMVDGEYDYVRQCLEQTMRDITTYNNSFAGFLNSMSESSQGMSDTIDTIMEKIKNGEGLEQLSVIKDIMGKKD